MRRLAGQTATGLSGYPAAAWWGLALSLLFILYETTIPFDFEFSRAQLAAGWEKAQWRTFLAGGAVRSRSDLVVNVPLFVPLGFFLVLTPLWRRAGWWRPLLLTALGLLVSLSVESLQLFSPRRYPQTTDLITNSVGTALGVALALAGGHRLFDRICAWVRVKVRQDPSALILVVLTVAILIGALLPLDFSITRLSLRRHLTQAIWDPFTVPAEGRLLAALSLVKQAWLFAFWGAAAAYRTADRSWPLARVMLAAALLSLFAETSHLFVVSRSIWTLTPLVTWCGAGLGAVAVLWSRALGLSGHRLALVAGIGYLVYLVADCLSPVAAVVVRSLMIGRPPDGGLGPAGGLPLWPRTEVSTLTALGAAAARLARFVPLGLGLRLLERRPSRRRLWAVLAAATVLGLELLVWRTSRWSGNVTEVLLAWAGMAAGWAAGAIVDRWRQQNAPQPEEAIR
jgi:glycopeptide antibiotics resistance protein